MDRSAVTWEKIQSLINPHFFKWFGIEGVDNVLEIRSVPADELVSPLRFDILAKWIYAKFWIEKLDSNWGKEVYIEHIKAFNNYKEADGSGKLGLNVFLDTYHKILESIGREGFIDTQSLIPVSRSGVVIDGSHRVAAALYYKKSVTIAKLNTSGFVFDYRFFRSKGMSTQYMDAVALEFCRFQKNAYVAILFPSAIGNHVRVVEILNKYGQIFYEKIVFLNRLGILNFVRQVYNGEPWVGDWTNKFSGALHKANACFAPMNPLRVFIYSSDNLENVKKAKEEIRNLFQMEKHSIHINDTHDQAIDMAQIVLNDNSIHFLNHAGIAAFQKFNLYFDSFRQWLISQKLPSNLFCVDGSAVLGAYGIREPADFDFIHHNHEGITTDIPNVRSHNDEIHHHVFTKDDLIFNPQNHFYFNGIKFVSLQALQKMKMKRGEPKDRRDVRMMARCLKNDKNILLGKISYGFRCKLGWIKNRLKRGDSRGIRLVERAIKPEEERPKY